MIYYWKNQKVTRLNPNRQIFAISNLKPDNSGSPLTCSGFSKCDRPILSGGQITLI
ncbi:hypothetical protein MC7420_4685 [Coleofasciculus chthonoplastes PCC 7420]|uniref:Uncharacterized protein n=1 Tax=Coleofasciculus chthonoplastes PCC 7420 TaxID=118168 RepID=B4VNW5_9CYAN|nr:hypothetical protein MC7420_4685 [Coleofasciculus chthonoplastes PCC 7420]